MKHSNASKHPYDIPHLVCYGRDNLSLTKFRKVTRELKRKKNKEFHGIDFTFEE